MLAVLDSVFSTPASAATFAAALVAAVASLSSIFWNLIAARRLEKRKAELQVGIERHKAQLQEQVEAQKSDYQRQLETMKSQLADFNSARSARRDYEYEARKRLYERIEPLLFQLHEAAEHAYFRVKSLARTARDGDLGDSDSWLGHEGYYLQSTIHRMLHPAAIFRLIQRQMTFVDLELDDSIRIKYYLLKIYVLAFTDDFVLARMAPELPYDPNHSDWEKLAQNVPARYRRQALVIGDLENALDAMLVKEDGVLRPKTFGEFEAALASKSDQRASLEELVQLYFDFSPKQRPILARMLLAQGCIAKLIFNSFHSSMQPDDLDRSLRTYIGSDLFDEEFGWSGALPKSERDVICDYVATRLNWIPDRRISAPGRSLELSGSTDLEGSR